MNDRRGQFRELIAWQKAYALCVTVYEYTAAFSVDERFGLTQQLRRAAVSVPSNIAEGWGRGSRVDYLRFLTMARGSLYEMETQLKLAVDLKIATTHEALMNALDETGRVLNGLIRSLKEKD